MRPGQNHHAFDVSSQALAYSGCPQASTATVSSTNNRQPLVVWPRPAINLSRAPVTCTHNLQVSNNKRVVPMYHLTATASDAVRDQIKNCQVYITVYYVVECPLSGSLQLMRLHPLCVMSAPVQAPTGQTTPNTLHHPQPTKSTAAYPHKHHSCCCCFRLMPVAPSLPQPAALTTRTGIRLMNCRLCSWAPYCWCRTLLIVLPF